MLMIALLQKRTPSESTVIRCGWLPPYITRPSFRFIFTAGPNPKLVHHNFPKPKSFRFGRFGVRLRRNKYKVSAAKKQLTELNEGTEMSLI
ncbi:hypothetical protein ACFX13_046486 [Malus domestica]